MDLLKWAIFILFSAWIIWYLTGGPQSGRVSQPFLRPPAPIDTGETYGEPLSIPGMPNLEMPKNELSKSENETISIFKGNITLGLGNPRAEKAEEEYLEIRASYNNTQPINITGWQLKSVFTGEKAEIEKGVYIPMSGVVNTEEQIFLNPGERAFISTGRSPNGVSFRLNSCTGYFEQFQNFIPSLPIQCPRPADENLAATPDNLDDVCIDYIKQIPSCFAHIQAVPIGLSPECSEYINKNIHYSGCMQTYKNVSDFYKSEWRIFLNKDKELWKQNRETIKLLDVYGRVADSLSY